MKKILIFWFIYLAIGTINLQAQTFSGGTGTVGDPYQITTRMDLETLSTQVAAKTTFADKYFKVMNDIDLGGSTKPWIPIGSYTSTSVNAPFLGNFDGNNKIISNLYINTTASYQGFFGYVVNTNQGSIKGIHIIKSSINTTGRNVGGIAGRCNAPITNCSYNGSIRGGSSTGGIIGDNSPGKGGIISHCFTSGYFSSTASIGGIAGQTSDTIRYCYSTAQISGSSAGGIVQSANTIVIHDCYFAGVTLGETYAFGIIGGRNAAGNGINDTLPVAFNTHYDKQLNSNGGRWLSNGYNGSDIPETTNIGRIDGYTTSQMLGTGLQSKLGSTNWVYEDGLYPRLSQQANSNVVKLAITPITLAANNTAQNLTTNFTVSTANGVVWTPGTSATNLISINGANATYNQGAMIKDSLLEIKASLDGNERSLILLGISPSFILEYPTSVTGGKISVSKNGVELAPNSKVSTGSILKVTLTNEEGYMPSTAQYTVSGVTKDIVGGSFEFTAATTLTFKFETITPWNGEKKAILNGSGTSSDPYCVYCPEELAWISDSCSKGGKFASTYFRLMNNLDLNGSQYTWKPIGNSSTLPFNGHFQGSFKTITNMKVNEPNNNVGLFGYVTSGGIKELNLTNSEVKGNNQVGGIIGYNTAVASYLSFSGTVSGNNVIGGIIGQTTGSLSQSIFSGDVSGKACVGGITGYTSATKLESLMSIGTVSGDSCVGGIAGHNTMRAINTSYSTSLVKGGVKVGGILGSTNAPTNGTMAKNYFAGSVECTRDTMISIGAIIGTNLTTTASTFNFYDLQMNPNLKGADKADITGKFEGRLTKSLLDSLVISANTAEFTYTSGLFPRLKSFENSSAVLLAASPVQLFVAANKSKYDQRDSVRENFIVSTANNVHWEISPATAGEINGSNVKILPGIADKKITLTASLNGQIKTYHLNLLPQSTSQIFGDKGVCSGDSAEIHYAFVGTPPFTYTLTGDIVNRTATTKEGSIKVFNAQTASYKIKSLYDAVGAVNYTSDSVTITVIKRPSVTFGEDFKVEIGDTAKVSITFTGTAPYTYQLTDDFMNRKAFTNDTTLKLILTSSKVYKVTRLNDALCTTKANTLTDSIKITVTPVGVLQPPHNLVANVFADEVNLSWAAPTTPQKLQWHKDYAYNGFHSGTNNFPKTYAAAIFEENDLLEFVGKKIDTLGFYPYHPIYKVEAMIFENDSLVSIQELDASKLVYKAPRINDNINIHPLNKLELKTPYTIKANKNVKIAMVYYHGANKDQFISIVDQGPAVAGKGDLTSTDGETFYRSGFANNVLTAYIGGTQTHLTAKDAAGYNVYRGTTKINSTLITDISYTAFNQPIGTQKYSIKTVDSKGNESVASYQASVEVVAPSEFRGAPVHLIGQDSGMIANLSWKAPLSGNKLTWNSANPTRVSALGLTGSAPKSTITHFFTADEVANFATQKIEAINVFFAGDSITELRMVIYQNEKLVYMDTVTNIPAKGSWAKIALKTPYTVQAGKSLHIGYFIKHITGAKPIALCNDYIDGSSNILSPNEFGESWVTLTSLSSSLKYGWMISADISGSKATPAITNYEIYRNGEKIETINTLFTKNLVPAPGTYTYSVKATYADGKLSPLSTPFNVKIGIPDDFPAPAFNNSYTNLDTVKLEWGIATLSNQLKWHGEAKYKWSLRNDGNDVDFSIGAGFDRNDLLPYSNHEITGIDIVLADDVFSVDVIIVIENEIVATARVKQFDIFETITTNFDTPFKIPANKDIIIGYHIVHEDDKSPLVLDNGPNVPGKGDLFNLASVDGDKRWFSFSSLPQGFVSNFVVAANVREIGSNEAPNKLTKSQALLNNHLENLQVVEMPKTSDLIEVSKLNQAPKAESIIGYNMYRNNKKANTNLITETKFTDTNLEMGIPYTYSVAAVYSNNWESNKSLPFTYTYKMHNLLPAPQNLVNIGDTNVKLTWKAPFLTNRIKWAKDTAQMSIGLTGSSNVSTWILNKFTPSDLAAYPNAKVIRIRFDLVSAQLLGLKVGVFLGEALVYQQDVTDWQVGTNVVNLDLPIAISPTQDLMIGYWAEYYTGVKPHATDYGPQVEGKGNVISTNGGYSFKTLTQMNAALKYNWVVSAYLQSDQPASVAAGSPIDSAFIYRIYRNDAIIKDNVMTLSYTAPKPSEDSKYHVTAVYGKQAQESAPSNFVYVAKKVAIDAEAKRADNSFIVYPNPSNGRISFVAQQNIIQLHIYDISGKLLRVLAVNDVEGSLDISNLNTGVYYVRMIGTSETKTVKIIKN